MVMNIFNWRTLQNSNNELKGAVKGYKKMPFWLSIHKMQGDDQWWSVMIPDCGWSHVRYCPLLVFLSYNLIASNPEAWPQHPAHPQVTICQHILLYIYMYRMLVTSGVQYSASHVPNLGLSIQMPNGSTATGNGLRTGRWANPNAKNFIVRIINGDVPFSC